MRRRWIALGALLAIAGCGGGGKTSVASTNGHPDPTAIAAKFDCTNYSPDTGQLELGAATQGSCSYQGDDVSILTFASSGALNQWEKVADTAGGGATGDLVIGNRFSIEASNADEAAAIATDVGGTSH